MLCVGTFNGGPGDKSSEDVVDSNLHVKLFLGLPLEGDVLDHAELPRIKTQLAVAGTWDGLFEQINRQMQVHAIAIRKGYHDHPEFVQALKNTD